MVPPSVSATSDSGDWKYLRLFARTLEHSSRTFGPLREVIGGFLDCIETFEGASARLKEYDILRSELDALFGELQGFCAGTMPPGQVREVQARGKLRQYLEAESDADEILACYRRIQNHFQRVALNANVSMWQIVDEIATDNRLNRLSPSLSACYNSAQAVGLKRGPCAKGTRIDIIAQMLGWADSSSPGSVYWMSGMAGTGKTTIAYSLCQELDASRRLAASFFCSRLLPECRNVSLIIPSIAYQLARCSHPFRFVLSGILENDPDVHTRLPHLQFDALISQPLLKVKDTLPDHFTVVIDALDECDDKESTSQMLDVLLTKSSGLPVRFVVSSRPEPEIRDEMTKQSDQAESRVVLHELDEYAVQADIEIYLRVSLAPMKPNEGEIATLVMRSGILFIYAATVVRYIVFDKFRRNPRARLSNVLSASNATENKHKEVDALYTTILRAALDNPDLDDLDKEDTRQVLHTVICAREPLTVSILCEFLEFDDTDRAHAALRPLWSVLHISGASELVTTLHASFPDFILDSSRSRQYHCDYLSQNQTLAIRCFHLFKNIYPQFNICVLKSSYLPDDKVEGLETRVQQVITPEVFYAAQYWAAHLTSSAGSDGLVAELEEFLSRRLLLWMEVMNLKKCSGDMAEMIRRLEKWDAKLSAGLLAHIRDAWRFTKAFALGSISESTPHIYTSMLPFWPETNPIAQCYARRMQKTIKLEGTALGQREQALVATWVFDSSISSSTFSPDGTIIALAVGESGVLLDSVTGKQVFALADEDNYSTTSIQFSHDGNYIVSASASGKFDGNSVISIWNTQNGELVLGPLEGHNGINYVAFVLDGTRCVSGSLESTCVWDTRSGDCLFDWTIEPGGNARLYSARGRYVLRGGWKPDIEVWDARVGQLCKMLYHSDRGISWVSIDISHDSTRAAAGSGSGSIYIWDIETGQLIAGPLAPSSQSTFIESLSFSYDGSTIVCAVENEGIYIWDAHQDSLVLGPLQGHTGVIGSVSFSPDGAYLISNSYGSDNTLRLWDTRSSSTASNPLEGHADSVISVGYLPDGTRIISTSYDHTTYMWDIETGEMIFGLIGFIYDSTPSPDSAYIACATLGGLVLLDAWTKEVVLGPLQTCPSIRTTLFSSDGTHIITASDSGVMRILAVNTGQTVMIIRPQQIQDYPDLMGVFIKLSPSSSHLVVGSAPYFIFSLYDTSTGRLLYDLSDGHESRAHSVAFSPDGTRVAAGLDQTIVVWDVESGKRVLGPLEGHIHIVKSLEYSPDGTCIVSGGCDNAVCIWNAQTGEKLMGPIKWHTNSVESISFSPDGTRITTGSADLTIRVTNIGQDCQYLSDSSTPTGNNWELKSDGWVVDDQGRLLVWVPSELHASLMWPQTKLLMSRKGWLRLNFSDAALGDSWAECYKSVLG
ncbi:WD repeat-containing protein 90 [Homo sapiens] [Rhizoctonia solani]|uniref:WD repeat-containing protein 90 [Homo sapiens] n=1 Tax=Rhizoctonia solani TaxID=456999 RepID=A0A0K6GBY7_9AGAM|nr:WD repeat-containing protein 90 [Homo sapiens] [Rhizoctonia solani]